MIWIAVEGYKSVPHEIGKYMAILFGVMVFILCGFEHCVANMFFIPMGLVARAAGSVPEGTDLLALGLGGFLSNLSAATLGNIIGGAVLFAGIYWLAYKRGK